MENNSNQSVLVGFVDNRAGVYYMDPDAKTGRHTMQLAFEKGSMSREQLRQMIDKSNQKTGQRRVHCHIYGKTQLEDVEHGRKPEDRQVFFVVDRITA